MYVLWDNSYFMMQAITKQRSVHDMDEIKTKAPPRLPALPALQRTPLLADAAHDAAQITV